MMKHLYFWISITAVLLLGACSGAPSAIPQTGVTAVPNLASTAVPNVTIAPSIVPTTTLSGVVTPTAGSSVASTQPATAVSQSTGTGAVSCTSPAAPTAALTEGPYWKQGSPERSSLLESGVTGTKLTLSGYVLTTDCKPVAHAWLDFWQANAQGQYDNNGYTLRGHQYTDANGHYTLETIVPGLYPGRTEHIHVKVQAPNGPVLTTQLFFPGVAQNQEDGIFDQSLVLPVQQSGDGLTATFNFVVDGQ
jgi:protocatechuate 3,4-dioxygenase beta subunit